jgi:hypothetical protein
MLISYTIEINEEVTMKRLLVLILLAALAIEGCSSKPVETQEAPTATQISVVEVPQEVRPGIYMSNDPADFPFPTSGYDVYIMGEAHGNRETKQLFQTYLKALYQEAGVRDVVLEEHSAYEPDANAYVSGKTDTLPEELCRRTDILGLIREFNTKLPEDQKVRVHLVDVDSPLAVIHKHLTDLSVRLGAKGASIQISPVSEMETWGPKSAYDLIAEFQSAAADQPDILAELATLRLSFKWYFAGNKLDGNTDAAPNFMPLREDIITQNMQNLISRLKGRPLLAFFGSRHAMKAMGANPPEDNMKAWAQQLSETGVDVYSLSVQGITGPGYWRGETFDYSELDSHTQYQFGNGSLLPSFFDVYPDEDIIYVDLRVKENQGIKMPLDSPDMPASQVFDGLLIFRQFTPMENACPSGMD